MRLRTIDLNLFRVFDAIMLHRSVRKASQVLAVTPSAVSHALSRLRQSIGDELFIPTDTPFLQLSDMVATLPRRLALWAAAHAPLSLLGRTVIAMLKQKKFVIEKETKETKERT
jgi:DNA-binding transcriptional LysR family regulator